MNVYKILSWKAARYILLMIVLGAAGSGAWEWILKPMLTGASSFGLSIATLGIERFKDSLYKYIALGFREESSLKLYSFILATLPCFLFGVLVGVLSSRKASRTGGENTLFARAMAKAGPPIFVMFAFLVAFSAVQVIQVTYINRAVTHFHQLLAIAGPYMSENEKVLYHSKFAQVSSKDDYIRVVEPL